MGNNQSKEESDRREEKLDRREEELRRKEQELELRNKQAELRIKETELKLREATLQQREDNMNAVALTELFALLAQQVGTVQSSRYEYHRRQQDLRASRLGNCPTAAEIDAARSSLGYKEGYFHFAIAGSAGCGKSSLINALRGKGDFETNSAQTGVVETTKDIARYPDNSWFTEAKFAWYDIPGCDTLDSSAEDYFNTQTLYIFDAILVVVDRQISASTVAIIRNCISWGVPWYLVRSKADQHIENLVRKLKEEEEAQGSLGDGQHLDEDVESKDANSEIDIQRRGNARSKFIADIRREFSKILDDAGLPQVYLYIISNTVLRRTIMRQRQVQGVIDEQKLIQHLTRDVFETHVIQSGQQRERTGSPTSTRDANGSSSTLL